MAGRILVVVWILVAAAIIPMIVGGSGETGPHAALRYLLHVGYVLALLWFLARKAPDIDSLPEIEAQLLPRRPYGAWIPVWALSLVLLLALLWDDGADVVLLLLMVATVWLLVAWCRQIRLRAVLQAVALALIAYSAALPAARNGMIQQSTLILLAALAAPMYVVGGQLVSRTRLGGARLLEGRYKQALWGLLRGCLLFVPLGLINAADGSPGPEIDWVTEWWMPLSLPWFSGIAEEIWFRLFMVSLCFFLLRPALRGEPLPAIVGAALFSSIIFGLGHGRELETFLTTGLLYGVPMAAVFVRRDWEHAVGAHYMINMIPWLMAFLRG